MYFVLPARERVQHPHGVFLAGRFAEHSAVTVHHGITADHGIIRVLLRHDQGFGFRQAWASWAGVAAVMRLSSTSLGATV